MSAIAREVNGVVALNRTMTRDAAIVLLLTGPSRGEPPCEVGIAASRRLSNSAFGRSLDGPEVTARHPGGSTAELLTVYALVNSLTANLPTIRRVQILIDGQEVLAQLSGRMRRFRIKVVPGDRVTVGVSPYDPVRGIITFRAR